MVNNELVIIINKRIGKRIFIFWFASITSSISIFNISKMHLVSIIVLIVLFVWLWSHSTPNHSVWEEMVSSFPEIVRVKREMPEYYAEFEKALQHAETVYTTILSKPLYHSRYVY